MNTQQQTNNQLICFHGMPEHEINIYKKIEEFQNNKNKKIEKNINKKIIMTNPMKSTTNQLICQAIKKDGNQCKWKAKCGSKYCGVHKDYIDTSKPLFTEEQEEDKPEEKETPLYSLEIDKHNNECILMKWKDEYDDIILNDVFPDHYEPKKKDFRWIDRIKEIKDWKEGEEIFIYRKHNCDNLFYLWTYKDVSGYYDDATIDSYDIMVDKTGYVWFKEYIKYDMTDRPDGIKSTYWYRVPCLYNNVVCKSKK